MIHYTLLPEQEMKSLKKEYRTRLFVILCLFMAGGIAVGTISLLPAYIVSYAQEKEALEQLSLIKEERHERGTDVLLQELTQTSALLAKMKERKGPVVYSSILADIVADRPAQVMLNSFQISRTQGDEASSTMKIIVQGKAVTREALLQFEKRLEANPLIADVQLPVSDLAKSRDISFSMNISFIEQQL